MGLAGYQLHLRDVFAALIVAALASPSLALGAARPTVAAVNGNIVLTSGGRSVQLTKSGMDLDPVLSPNGAFYIDPYYHLDDRVYAVYSADNTFNVPDFYRLHTGSLNQG